MATTLAPYTPAVRPSVQRDAMTAFGLTLLCGVVVAPLLRVGWVPSDEGTLAASAARVLQGQWPQRDFAEVYTGGLSVWHALAMRCLGVNLFSLRLAAFVAFLAWVPCVYWIARRWLGSVWAAVATLGCVGWSYPNYVAAMPSWYNLFFATGAVAALLRFLETRRRRWLCVAGTLAGASILVKIVGLYLVAAALLFFLYLEQACERRTGSENRPFVYRACVVATCLSYLAALVVLLRHQLGSGAIYSFVLPSLLCVGLLVWRETGSDSRDSRARIASFLGLAGPFLTGTAAVLLLFWLPFAWTGSAGAMIAGVLGSARARSVDLAGRIVAPPLGYALYAVAPAALLAAALWGRGAARQLWLAVTALVLAAVLACSALLPGLQDTWMMAGLLTPLLVLLGVLELAKGRGEALPQQQLMLLLAVVSLCSLVQFPVSYVTYFCYVAPLVLLAAVALACLHGGARGRSVEGVLLAFFAVFGWAAVVPKHVYNPGLRWSELATLQRPHGAGLHVDLDSAAVYEALIPFLQAHSPNGMLYAGSDCPQLYFLSGLRNPTRDDTGAPADQVLAAVHSGLLQLVVLNEEPFFHATGAPDALRKEVARALPYERRFGNFHVYWSQALPPAEPR